MTESAHAADVDLVIECLSKNIGELEWLTPLKLHLEQKILPKWAAIGFDTNALKQLRRYPAATRSSILTYLQKESVRIILPAQAVQEFWNNHGIFTRDVQNLQGDIQKLAERLEKLGSETTSRSIVDGMISQLQLIGGDIVDSQNPHLLKDSIDLWEGILPDSTVAHIPRELILTLGETRLICGIAPGFADDKKKSNRLGDFFVWADFMMGLRMIGLTRQGDPHTSIAFITDDEKADWKTSCVPHPTLLGEVYRLTGKPLVIMSMRELERMSK